MIIYHSLILKCSHHVKIYKMTGVEIPAAVYIISTVASILIPMGIELIKEAIKQNPDFMDDITKSVVKNVQKSNATTTALFNNFKRSLKGSKGIKTLGGLFKIKNKIDNKPALETGIDIAENATKVKIPESKSNASSYQYGQYGVAKRRVGRPAKGRVVHKKVLDRKETAVLMCQLLKIDPNGGKILQRS